MLSVFVSMLLDHCIGDIAGITKRTRAARATIGTALATAASVPSRVIWARTATGVSCDRLLNEDLTNLLIRGALTVYGRSQSENDDGEKRTHLRILTYLSCRNPRSCSQIGSNTQVVPGFGFRCMNSMIRHPKGRIHGMESVVPDCYPQGETRLIFHDVRTAVEACRLTLLCLR